MSKAVVKNSLLSSSINIKNISRSVNSFANAFTKSQRIASDIQKQTKDANDFKSKLVRNDDSYFRKRQENIQRKDREDEIESSTVGGAIRRTGSVVSKSTRGFLGRMLDFIGVLFVGWILNTLPNLNKSIVGFIKRASILVGSLGSLIDTITSSLFSFGSNLKDADESIRQIDFTEDEKFINEELDSTESAFRQLTKQIFGAFNWFNDPKRMGIPANSWNDLETLPPENILPNGALPFYTQGEDKNKSNVTPPSNVTPNDAKDNETKEDIKKDSQKPEETEQKPDSNEGSTEKTEQKTDSNEGSIETKEQPQDNSDKDVFDDEPDYENDREAWNEWNQKESDALKANPDSSGLDMFKDGGIVKGKSHQEGGENINVEGGEAIVPKKSVEKYTPEFINRIIKGDADKVTKLRASRSLLEKLVEQHKEANMGLIRVDEYDKLQEQTIGKLKEFLTQQEDRFAQQEDQIQGVRQKIESIDLGGLEPEDAIEVQKSLISSFINPIKTSRKSSFKRVKKPKILPIPAKSPSSSKSSRKPSSPPINKRGSSSSIPVKTGGDVWNKLQVLELQYT